MIILTLTIERNEIYIYHKICNKHLTVDSERRAEDNI